MIKQITFNDFTDTFKKMGRDGQFSYEGKEALFNYFENMGEQTGKPIELDVIALCCEFTEYKDLKELQKNYDVDTMEKLENNTIVIPVTDDSFIIQDY